MSSPASKRGRLSASRTSLSGRKSLQGGPTAVPRAGLGASRLATTQPTYDFLGGGAPEMALPLKRTSLRQPSIVRDNSAHDENLRAKINALEYEVKTLQQEKTVTAIQHERELRDLQAKADADFKKYQAAESASQRATQRYDSLTQALRNAQDQYISERATLEKRLRGLEEQIATYVEEAEDVDAQLADQERHYKYQIDDVETKRAALQETVDSVRTELEHTAQEAEAARARLAQRELDVERLEAQVADLQAHTGDTEALSVVQRELSDQVAHIRKLESANRDQLAELRRLREGHRSVQVVEEQKHALETELQVLRDVHRQLGEAQIQKEILEDEKRTWKSLLDSLDQEIESPEAVVKALAQARIEHASLVDRLGQVESEMSEKDEMIRSLASERSALAEAVEQAQARATTHPDGSGDDKAYKRLDRQRVLAVKEVEYLRAQLKTFDTEETVLMDNPNFDTQRSHQVQQLESLVDQYKSEIQTLHADLTKAESSQSPAAAGEPRGTKRPADAEPSEDTTNQLGPLLRKNKNLQIALQKTTSQSQMLATELQATKSQLKELRNSSKTRILELRDNPTAQAEAVKLSTLNTLKAENAALLSQLRGGSSGASNVGLVPSASLDALTLSLAETQKQVAEREKRMKRLREIWTDKAAEFRDVVASVLGYRINFLPNGKVKVGSMFYGPPNRPGDQNSADDDEDENFIMFDGENGTMKIGGGSQSAFGEEIKELVEFWVKGRKEIPCFLAAMTLEFYDRFRGGRPADGVEGPGEA